MFGDLGLRLTVIIAIVASVSGVIASVFAVSRMLAMLTDMELVPHSHFGMRGSIQKHCLVYTVVVAMLLTVFFDLGRIASLGTIFYVVMDIAVHWGVLRHLRLPTGKTRAVLTCTSRNLPTRASPGRRGAPAGDRMREYGFHSD